LFCLFQNIPTNGSTAEVMASCWVSSRHCVLEMMIALVMTLMALAKMAYRAAGALVLGHGTTGGAAKAVSAVIQTIPTPHGSGAATALTGTIEGAQKNTLEKAASATHLRSFMTTPCDSNTN
jgi:hypothetical protein